jgi:hypothetical protein
MDRLILQSTADGEGLLHLTITLGATAANCPVKVTIEPLALSNGPAMTQEEWAAFVRRTAGSIKDSSFRRHEQGEYETRSEFR